MAGRLVAVRGRRPSLDSRRAALIAGLVLLLISWSPKALPAQPGLDPSWYAGVNMAVVHGLAWGRDFVFTYGPLAFLYFPHYFYGATWTIAVIHDVAIHLLLLAVLWYAARRSFGAIAATVLLAIVAVDLGDPVAPLAFAGAMWFLSPVARRQRSVIAGAAALGAFVGLESLVKLNYGVTAFVVGLIGVAAMRPPPRLRRFFVVASYLVAAAVSALGFWIAAGQPIDAIPDYVEASTSVIVGYPAAQSLGTHSLNWQYPAFALSAALGLAGLVVVTSRWPKLGRAGVVAIWLVIAYSFFKEGFVRHALSHSLVPFAAFMASLLAVVWTGGRRVRALGFVAIVVPFIVLVHTQSQSPGDLFSPIDRARAAWHDAHVMFSARERHELVKQGQRAIEANDKVPPPVIRALRGRTVWITPYEEALAWAYHLRWRPVPSFQWYLVYTKFLDSKNVNYLRGARAPERILVGPGPSAISSVLPWAPPGTTHAMLCRYRPVIDGPVWDVLARDRYACGTPRIVRSVHARAGRPVRVPALPAGAGLLTVRIHGLELDVADQVRSAIFKPQPRYFFLGRFGQLFIVPYAARGPIALRASRASGFENWLPNQDVISADIKNGSDRTLRYDFYAEPLRRNSKRP